jgi:hypothetical protein
MIQIEIGLMIGMKLQIVDGWEEGYLKRKGEKTMDAGKVHSFLCGGGLLGFILGFVSVRHIASP